MWSKADAERYDWHRKKVREIEVQVQRLFEPVPVVEKERCIIVRAVDGTRLVRRVIES